MEEGFLSDVVAMVHLECRIVDFKYGRVDSAKLKFEVAEKVCGLRGSLGIGGEGGDGLKRDSQVHEASGVLLTPRVLDSDLRLTEGLDLRLTEGHKWDHPLKLDWYEEFYVRAMDKTVYLMRPRIGYSSKSTNGAMVATVKGHCGVI
nr:hypothetical protein [Tanacetum cinerariifolium]